MKWILAMLLFISATIYGQTDDSTKYIRYQNQYGMRMPRLWSDSVLRAAGLVKFTGIAATTDTTTYKPVSVDASGNVHKMARWPVSPTDSTIFATVYSVDTAKVNLRGEIAGKQDAGNYITALTGDVTASGPGSAAATLANTAVTPGSYTNADITVDAKGRITAAANGSGGSISGLTAGRVTLSTSGTTVGDDAGLTYNSTTNEVTTDSATLLNIRINEDPYIADSIHFRGTSISNGTSQSPGNRFTTLVSNKLNAIESNASISGASLVVQGVANIPTLPIFDRAKYRWIILEWGVNDINSATDSTTFDNAYRSYIDTLIIARGWPADRIVILAPSYLDPVLIPTATLAKQAQFRGATQSIATDKGTKWVDIYTAQLYRNPSNLLTDGIHPNDYGAYVYVNAITKTIGDSVMSTNQNISVNGITELQRLKLRTVDTADYKSAVIGMDSAGNIARFTKDQIIQNSTTLLQPQGASISLVGSGLFGNVSSPNSLDKLQVNGAAVANGYRATGTEPSGETGSYIGMFYASDMGFIYARAMPANTAKNITIAPFGGTVMMGTSTASGGTERLNVSGGIRGGFGHFTGTLGTLTGSGVEIGMVSGSGYLGAYNRTGSAALPLTVQLLGGNMMVGTNTDGGEKFQVAGTVAFDIGSDATGDIYYRNSGGSFTRLGIGSSGNFLQVSSGLPSWQSTLSVANGGTGNTSLTAYALLAGGTTGTGALQQVSGTGTLGQVLTSAGAGALPTWQTLSLNGSTTHDFGTIANNSSATTTVSVTGAADGDFVVVTKPVANGWSNGESYTAWVSAADQVTVRQNNNSGGSAGFGSQTINVKVIKQ